ncbi:hypothetical protein PJWF_00081 [Achromobacter phage JWF]|uniref:hypothetical protein n=1 Tax=Achromobacter phage JWF TaxID=1589748 RepID=UPI000588E7F5|nr:hypothetical protein AXJ13_gp107 [Achromobacter phage JWF]AJD82974.1 hypothetical protein PJWF_00081 [Achromobacter phage JWF]
MPRCQPTPDKRRAGQAWGVAEDSHLMEMWQGGMTISQIARCLLRTTGAIQSRLHRSHNVEWWMRHTNLTPNLEPETMNTNLEWTSADQSMLDGLLQRKKNSDEAAKAEIERRYNALSHLVIEAVGEDHQVAHVQQLVSALMANANAFIQALGPQAALQAVGSVHAEDTILGKGRDHHINRSSAVRRIHLAMNSPSGSFSYAAAQRALDAMIELGLVTNHARRYSEK